MTFPAAMTTFSLGQGILCCCRWPAMASNQPSVARMDFSATKTTFPSGTLTSEVEYFWKSIVSPTLTPASTSSPTASTTPNCASSRLSVPVVASRIPPAVDCRPHPLLTGQPKGDSHRVLPTPMNDLIQTHMACDNNLGLKVSGRSWTCANPFPNSNDHIFPCNYVPS